MWIYIVAFLFGVTNKLADLMNEHGLFWFKRGDALFGVIWGLLGIPLVIYDQYMAAAYIALVLQWHLELKLDRFNHAFAGTMILLGGIYYADHATVNIWHVVALVAAYYATWLVQSHFKNKSANIDKIIRLRTRIYLIPFFYSLYTGQWLVFFSTVVSMIGVEAITIYYKRVKGIA